MAIKYPEAWASIVNLDADILELMDNSRALCCEDPAALKSWKLAIQTNELRLQRIKEIEVREDLRLQKIREDQERAQIVSQKKLEAQQREAQRVKEKAIEDKKEQENQITKRRSEYLEKLNLEEQARYDSTKTDAKYFLLYNFYKPNIKKSTTKHGSVSKNNRSNRNGSIEGNQTSPRSTSTSISRAFHEIGRSESKTREIFETSRSFSLK